MRQGAPTRQRSANQDWLSAARLVRRSGFGATGAQVDAVVAAGTAAFLAAALAADPSADPGAAHLPAPAFGPVAALGKNADTAARQARRSQITDQLRQLTGWWLRRMVQVDQPVTEKLTFIWHNHFATAATKVQDATLMLGQNQTLRAQARGNFRTLALAMLTDPAMLMWLDGQKNVAGAPNENLSREFMELFTLGHGNGYTEQDVRDGARALTGWTVAGADGTARLVAARHDNGSKTVLGVTGNLDEAGYCDAVLAQPATAEHVVARLFGQLGSDQPLPAASVTALATTFRSGWDISALLTAMLLGDDFAAAQGAVVIGPVEWMVGALRALRIPVDDDAVMTKVIAVLQALGQVPFYPPSVAGWPAGQAWLSTAAADLRFTAAVALVKNADLGAISGTAEAGRVDAVGYQLGVGAWSDRSRSVLQDAAADPRKLVAIALNTREYLTN
ncbi:MAG TPA: DUF1800 domain-containing protein [Nakamurella sp.]